MQKLPRDANLTFHSTGLGNKSKEDFVRQFKQYSPELYTPTKVGEGEFQTIMPWTMYAGMDTTDLASIYEYLRSLEPINNPIEKVTFAKINSNTE